MARSWGSRSPPGRWVSPATARPSTAATAAARCLLPSPRWTRSRRCGEAADAAGRGAHSRRARRELRVGLRDAAPHPAPRSPGRPSSRIHPAQSRKPRGQTKLSHHRAGIAAGSDVHPQVTCRPVTFQLSMADPSTLYMVPAFSRLSALDRAGRIGVYRDPAWRSLAAAELDSGKHVDMRWDACVVSETNDPEVAGRIVADISRERGSHPLECLLDIALADELASRFTINFANDDPRPQPANCCRSRAAFSACPTPVRTSARSAMPSCRVDFLAHWVRDRELMPVEAGIRRAHRRTRRPHRPAWAGLSHRGRGRRCRRP